MPTVKIDSAGCKGCVLCVGVCPQKIILQGKEINPQGYLAAVLEDPEGKCTGCTLCALTCPDMCIEVFK